MHERPHGFVVWVLGPAVAFDLDARNAFARLIAAGHVGACWPATRGHPRIEGASSARRWAWSSTPSARCTTGTTTTWTPSTRGARPGPSPRPWRTAASPTASCGPASRPRALCPGRLHPRRRPPARGSDRQPRGPGSHARADPESDHGHRHGHPAPCHRRGQHDPELRRHPRRGPQAGLLLHRGT